MSDTTRTPRSTIWDERDAMIRRASHAMRSWAEFTETIDVPMDIAAALASGRPELMRLAPPRPLDAGEVATLYKLIAVLIETNMALQSHARELASMGEVLDQQMRGAVGYARRMQNFANFRPADGHDE